MAATAAIKCAYSGCDHSSHFLPTHLAEVHNLSTGEYLTQFPGAPTASQALLDAHASRGSKRRTGAPKVTQLAIDFAGINMQVNHDVPASVCLPMPDNFRMPKYGTLGKDIKSASIALAMNRSTYIWGIPGCGKDALVHAYSAQIRRPAEIFSVRPGEDIQSWYYSRSFDQNGTMWEEGRLLKIARDGYTTKSGRVIPYVILISDVDRADKAQAESLRLILDSISGRIKGPEGITYPVLPGTLFVFTANSAGSGDERGRCISANPIDASLLDRIQRKFQFHWMDWRDEGEIVKAKFPLLLEKVPEIFDVMGACTQAIREAVKQDELYAEFSHRALCSLLGMAQDIVEITGRVPNNLIKHASRAWIDGLPDKDARVAAKRLMDPHVKGGVLDPEP